MQEEKINILSFTITSIYTSSCKKDTVLVLQLKTLQIYYLSDLSPIFTARIGPYRVISNTIYICVFSYICVFFKASYLLILPRPNCIHLAFIITSFWILQLSLQQLSLDDDHIVVFNDILLPLSESLISDNKKRSWDHLEFSCTK